MARTRSTAFVAALAGMLLAAAGCDTLGSDLADVSASFNPPSPGEAARQMLDPHDADMRRRGTTLISNSTFGGGPVYVSAYRDMVENETDPVALAAAVRALGRHGDVEDAPLLAEKLTHENRIVRWEAAAGLQRLHNPVVVPGLLATLGNVAEEPPTRVAAATALGQYPEDRVFQGLIAAMDARELSINHAAEQALTVLTGQALGPDAADWLAWYEPARAAGTAFADQQEYRYPTYSRTVAWYEKIAFWTPHNFEEPSVPVGLRPEGERRTYEDQDEHESGG